MDLQNWSRQQITNLIANYERLDRTEGGPFTKAQAMLELERRDGGDFDGRDVTQSILKIRDKAPNGSVRYLDIWTHYFPDQSWQGNHSGRIVGKALHAAAYYCATNNLPIVTALVTQANGHVTDQAKQNMFEAAQNWGVARGAHADEFYEINIAALRGLGQEELP
jgi:hypothetical protein